MKAHRELLCERRKRSLHGKLCHSLWEMKQALPQAVFFLVPLDPTKLTVRGGMYSMLLYVRGAASLASLRLLSFSCSNGNSSVPVQQAASETASLPTPACLPGYAPSPHFRCSPHSSRNIMDEWSLECDEMAVHFVNWQCQQCTGGGFTIRSKIKNFWVQKSPLRIHKLDPRRAIGFTKSIFSFDFCRTIYRSKKFLPNMCRLGVTSFLFVLTWTLV